MGHDPIKNIGTTVPIFQGTNGSAPRSMDTGKYAGKYADSARQSSTMCFFDPIQPAGLCSCPGC